MAAEHKNQDQDTNLSLLFNAVREGNLEQVTRLSQEVNDINEKDDGQTALILACKSGNNDVLDLLLSRENIDTGITDDEGYTPLHCLASNGNLAGIKRLLNLFPGTAIDALATKDDTPLILACKSGHADVIQFLHTQGADLHHRNRRLYTGLIYAANYGHVEALKKMIELGGDINSRNIYEQTALMFAAQWGHRDACELLLQRGAPVDSTCTFNYTALLYTCLRAGHADVAQLLLDKGANPDQEGQFYNKAFRSPLYCSCYVNDVKMTRVLLDCDADIDYPYPGPHYVSAALYACARQGSYDCARFLLERNVTVSRRAVIVARKNGHEDMASLLQEYV